MMEVTQKIKAEDLEEIKDMLQRIEA